MTRTVTAAVLLIALVHVHGTAADDDIVVVDNTFECNSDEFKCIKILSDSDRDEACFPKDHYCDNYYDCYDGSDEISCTINKQCNSTWQNAGNDRFPYLVKSMTCGNGACARVAKLWYPHFSCDGQVHCLDGSDELGCADKQCGEDKLRCRTDKGDVRCYTIDQLCDGVEDCEDGSDELKESGLLCPDLVEDKASAMKEAKRKAQRKSGDLTRLARVLAELLEAEP